jgi:hypothetical protein
MSGDNLIVTVHGGARTMDEALAEDAEWRKHPLFEQLVQLSPAQIHGLMRAVHFERHRIKELALTEAADVLVAEGLVLSAENFVVEWHRRGRPRLLHQDPWEYAFRRAGAIADASSKEYVRFGRHVTDPLSVTDAGEALCRDE